MEPIPYYGNFVWIFQIWVCIFGSYGFLLNSKNHNLLGVATDVGVVGFLILLTLGYLWYVYQINFGVRLTLSEEMGEYRGMGYRIQFKWVDVDEVNYIPLPRSQPGSTQYQLCLYLDKPHKVYRGIHMPNLSFAVYPNRIPLDMLYPQGSLNIKPVSEQEAIIFYNHFMETPLGQDLLRYAPHAFRFHLHRYLDEISDTP